MNIVIGHRYKYRHPECDRYRRVVAIAPVSDTNWAVRVIKTGEDFVAHQDHLHRHSDDESTPANQADVANVATAICACGGDVAGVINGRVACAACLAKHEEITVSKKSKKAKAEKAEKATEATKATKATKATEGGKMSALDAAAQVLTSANGPMNTKDMINAMAELNLWSSPNGKTPHATLYAAILREINVKGSGSRFVKADRGQFALKC